MKSETIPGFDCIEYKRRVQSEIYEKIKDMTVQEQIEFFCRAAEEGPLGDWWRKVKAASNQSRA